MFHHRQACRLRRDDGNDATLLRERPTNSRAPDAFVKPSLGISGADLVLFLRSVEGKIHHSRLRFHVTHAMILCGDAVTIFNIM